MKKYLVLLLAAILVLSMAPALSENQTVISDEILAPVEVEILEPTPTPIPKSVHIEIEGGWPRIISMGQELKIISRLVGFEDASEIWFEWEVNRHDGKGYAILANENKDTLTIIATKETLSYDYRLVVHWEH